MAPLEAKRMVRERLFRRTLLRIALCLPPVIANGGCVVLGYGETAASDVLDASGDADPGSEGGVANDASSSLDASDGNTDADASFDAATDSSTLDASSEPTEDAGDGGLDAAELDGSPEGGADASTEGGADASTDGAVDASTDSATPQCDGGTCTPRCDLTGTYALKLRVPATWPSTSQINSGSGTFEFRFRVRATHVDNTATIQLQQCGQTVPVIQAQLVNESSLFTFPNSLFDTEVLPSSSGTMSLGDSTASSSLSLAPVAMQLGVKLNDPLNDAWPSTAAGLTAGLLVDAEGDGNPAATAVYSNASGYVYPRTSTSLIPQRARQAYIATRRVFSMAGALTSCDGSQGAVTLSKLDSHMLGCRHPDNSLCSATEANNLDTGLPKYQFSAGTYVMSRVADGATCSTLRTLP